MSSGLKKCEPMTHDTQRILSIDYGTVRIGIAISDPLRLIAQALDTYPNNDNFIPKLTLLLQEHGVGMIVVGMPLNLKGREEQKAREVRLFIDRLSETVSVPIRTWDERFTSTMAKQALLDMGIGRKKRQEKSRVDQIAAALLLQSFLDAKAYENE
jgi:putative Holliday junction resolvase